MYCILGIVVGTAIKPVLGQKCDQPKKLAFFCSNRNQDDSEYFFKKSCYSVTNSISIIVPSSVLPQGKNSKSLQKGHTTFSLTSLNAGCMRMQALL